MSGNGEGKPTRGSERVPIEAQVDLEFESFQGFLSEYSSNISLGGMFVKASEPPPVGTSLKFSLRLKGDFSLIQGRGEVVWIRREGESNDHPAGAGIRFLNLETASEDLIRRMVERYRVQGGRPFELEVPEGSEDTQAASILEAAPEKGLQDDIFIPPDIPLAEQTSVSVPPLESPIPPSPPAVEPAPRRQRIGPGTVVLLFCAAILGGLVSHFGERLVGWATGYDRALAERVVYDVPPPASLASKSAGTAPAAAELPPPEEPSQRSVTPAEAGVTDLGPGRLPDGTGDSWLTFGEDYDSAEEGLNRIRLITWKEAAEGRGTVVTLWGNGNLRRENIARIRLGGQPARELIKLKGIDWPFRDPVLDVDSTEVRRIRTGFHPKETLNELHVVIDLRDSESELRLAELGGRSIQLFFYR